MTVNGTPRWARRRSKRCHPLALVGLLLGMGAASAVAPPPLAAAGAPSARSAAVAQGADPSRTDAAGVEWLCRPGLPNNPCLSNENALVVRASGRRSVQLSRPAPNPPIDCFYVYPTVSGEPGVTANLEIQPAESGVARLQASRFSKACKVYAPIYPQVTRYGLTHPGSGLRNDIQQGYDVVQAAWKDYMEHYNHGRGVVVIGHSQGSTMAQQLLRTQVDPNPRSRKLLVSAILPGGNVVVPVGGRVGGTFEHLGACTTASQLHCVIAYSSFDQTPPAGTLFGRPGTGVSFLHVTPSPTKGMMVLCVNPAQFTSGKSGILQPYFPNPGSSPASTSATAPGTSAPVLPWVTQPDLYSGKCRYENGTSWLQVTAPLVAGDPRTVVTPALGPAWGLHLDDVNLFLGNLVAIVSQQSKAFVRSRS